MNACSTNPLILFYEKKISSMTDLLPLLEQIAKSGSALLVVADDVEGRSARDAGRQQSARHPAVHRGQGAGIRRPPQAMLDDLAILTGGRLIAESSA